MRQIIAAYVLIGGSLVISFFAGEIYGRHEVMSNTVVRAGFPRFLNQQYFGDCVRIAHNLETVDAEACATIRGDK